MNTEETLEGLRDRIIKEGDEVAEKENKAGEVIQAAETEDKYQAALLKGHVAMGFLCEGVQKYKPYVVFGKDEAEAGEFSQEGAEKLAAILVKYDFDVAPSWIIELWDKWQAEIKAGLFFGSAAAQVFMQIKAHDAAELAEAEAQAEAEKEKMINKNEALKNRHALFAGITGSGKTQAMAQSEHLKIKANQCIFWDTHGTFKAQQYNNIPELINALIKACNKGGGFRIAYTGRKSVKAFNELCEAVAIILDGNKTTVLIVDEYASIADSIGKDKTPFGDLLRESRKFGLIILVSATRTAEIPKTIFTNCQTKVIGAQGSFSDAKTMADFLQIKKDMLLDTELDELNFWVKQPNQAAYKAVIEYKKPPL